MPRGLGGGGGGIPETGNAPSGTYTLTASTSAGVHVIPLEAGVYLSDVAVAIFGAPAGTITGGAVKVRLYLVRGMGRMLVAEGIVLNRIAISGSGCLDTTRGGSLVLEYWNPTASNVTVVVDAHSTTLPTTFGWAVHPQQHKVYWRFRQVCTQDNAGGGNLVARITPAAGTGMVMIQCNISASGNRAANVQAMDTDGNSMGFLSVISAVAAAQAAFPYITTSYTTSAAPAAGFGAGGALVSPNYIYAQVASAAQTETATLSMWCELTGAPVAPTVIWTDSAGTPNAATATENTIEMVVF